MTTFSPNHLVIQPAHRPEQLAEGVVCALARPMSPRLTWRPLQTIALGLLSGGLLPLIWLPKRFRDFVNAEQTHLWHFTEWLRLQFPGPDTDKLQSLAERLRFRMALWIGSLALAGLAVAWAASDLTKLAQRPVFLLGPFGSIQIEPALRPLEPRFLFNFTARLPHLVKQSASMPRVLIAAEGFTMLLIAAHMLSLWQVMAHWRDVRGLVEQFNVLAGKQEWEPVRPPRPRLGLDASWLVGIVGLVLLGAWWGVPMMLTASAQLHYVRREGRSVRLALSSRVRDQLARRRPLLHVPSPAAIRRGCTRPACSAVLPAGAGFCPRCGLRVARIDVVAQAGQCPSSTAFCR